MTTETILFSSNIGDTVSPVVRDLTVNSTTILTGAVSGAGFSSSVLGIAKTNAPTVRYLQLTDVHVDSGLPLLTATAATTLPGIARTSGTSLYLTGVATAGATPATTNMIWEFDVPDTYTAGADIPVLINCVVPVATNITAASTTMTVAAYSVSSLGVETALTVSAAQQMAITTASTLTFTVTGTTLVVGSRIVLKLTALVTTTSGGASSVRVNSVGFTA